MITFLSCVSPDLSPRAPHLGLISHPASQPPAHSGGIYTAFLSPAWFPTAQNPYHKPSRVWPLGKRDLAPHGTGRILCPLCIDHTVLMWGTWASLFNRGSLAMVPSNLGEFRTVLDEVAWVSLSSPALHWVLVRSAWEGRAGEAGSLRCSRTEQWWCFHLKKQASLES